MKTKTNNKDSELPYSFHKPADSLDPGFKVRGWKWRWISARKQEVSPDRPWTPLHVDFLKSAQPSLFEKLKERHMLPTTSDGLFRKGSGELVLAYSTEDAIKPYKVALAEENLAQLERVSMAPASGKGMQVKAEMDEDIDMGAAAFQNL